MDLIHDDCVDRQRFRSYLTMIDEFTRGLPKRLVVDHGPEFMGEDHKQALQNKLVLTFQRGLTAATPRGIACIFDYTRDRPKEKTEVTLKSR